MRAIEPLPATRFDFDRAVKEAKLSGNGLAQIMPARASFKSSEECWLSYGAMPYIGENRAAERRLLRCYRLRSRTKRSKTAGRGRYSRQADILIARRSAARSKIVPKTGQVVKIEFCS